MVLTSVELQRYRNPVPCSPAGGCHTAELGIPSTRQTSDSQTLDPGRTLRAASIYAGTEGAMASFPRAMATRPRHSVARALAASISSDVACHMSVSRSLSAIRVGQACMHAGCGGQGVEEISEGTVPVCPDRIWGVNQLHHSTVTWQQLQPGCRGWLRRS